MNTKAYPITQWPIQPPTTPPAPRTGVLTKEFVHLPQNGQDSLESAKRWGYYALVGEVSRETNPDIAPLRPYYIRYYPFAEVSRLPRGGDNYEVLYRASAVIAVLDPLACAVGDFYKRFEFTRDKELVVPIRNGENMIFRSREYSIRVGSTGYDDQDYEYVTLWERMS